MGEVEDHLCMGAEGRFKAEFLELVFNERRDPIGIPLIDLPGESDEDHEIVAVFNLLKSEFRRCHIV
jgi:hypothetical protein